MPSQYGHDLLLGGEATMWTDEYCPHSKCVGHAETWGGKVGWLFEKKKTSSLPKLSYNDISPIKSAAGSFWIMTAQLAPKCFYAATTIHIII